MKKFVIGDIHGNFIGLLQCLERSGFNKNEDLLISLGDIVDGFLYSKEVTDELMSVKNLVFIRGNHDDWFLEYLRTGVKPHYWVSQGGRNTLKSFGDNPDDKYKKFFLNSSYYYEEGSNLFLHGGINPYYPTLEFALKEGADDLMWDREMIRRAMLGHYFAKNGNNNPHCPSALKPYDKTFIGHSGTQYFDRLFPDECDKPIVITFNNGNKLICMDQGGGEPKGKLSIMNIDTLEYWQSDLNETLGPDYKTNGRGE